MTTVSSPPEGAPAPTRQGLWPKLLDQFGFRQMVSEYLIPVETNSIWYLLGGVLAIALGLEILTGLPADDCLRAGCRLRPTGTSTTCSTRPAGRS